jgi:hypothetical protein
MIVPPEVFGAKLNIQLKFNSFQYSGPQKQRGMNVVAALI